jgi:hypothetical protein
MPTKHPPIKLSPEEQRFLRHWMHDETHDQTGLGPAKRLQLQHGIVPADLALLVAAAFPNLADQEAASTGAPPAEPPSWPWSAQGFQFRLAEARATLVQQHPRSLDKSEVAGGRPS